MLLTILVLAFSHLITSRRLSATRKELLEFRYQYGVLVVDDPSRPHVLRYANLENPWKWHINLPNGKNYKLMCGIGAVPQDEIPNAAVLQHVQETWVSGDGENKTIFVSLTETDSDTLRFSIGGDGSQTISQHIAKDDIFERSVFNSFSVGYGEAFVAEKDAPFVVFSQTERSMTPSVSSDETARGVVVWMVPVK